MPVLKYCIHLTNDGTEIVHPIADGQAFLRERVAANWRALPMRERVTEAGVRKAVDAAVEEAFEVLRQASLRV